MASHVYPFVFSFKPRNKNTETRVVLLDTTRSRKGDWVIRVKDGWDEPWATIVNVDKTFGSFLTFSRSETKHFQVKPIVIDGVSVEAKRPEIKARRELEGGKLGYSRGAFFWNVLRWSFVQAIANGYVHSLDDYLYEDEFDRKLNELPDPTEIEGKKRTGIEKLPDYLQWEYAGLDYNFDYLQKLEKILKPINFKILTHF